MAWGLQIANQQVIAGALQCLKKALHVWVFQAWWVKLFLLGLEEPFS